MFTLNLTLNTKELANIKQRRHALDGMGLLITQFTKLSSCCSSELFFVSLASFFIILYIKICASEQC